MKTTNAGNNYVKSSYDEVTGNLPVTDGLVFYMDPMKTDCYPETGTTAYDLSSSRNTITLNNVSFNKDGYFDYDGSTSWANTSYIQPVTQTSTSFTWNIWFKPLRGNSTEIVMGNRYGYNFQDFLQFIKLTTIGWEYYGTAGQQGVQTPSTNVTVNVWQNVTMVKNGTTLSYYRNGVFIASSTITGTINMTNPLQIGGFPEVYKGSIGIVNIYNRPLNTQEITDNFDAFRSRYGI
jgi:hypothetical protein